MKKQEVYLLELLKRRSLNFKTWIRTLAIKDWNDLVAWCQKLEVLPPSQSVWQEAVQESSTSVVAPVEPAHDESTQTTVAKKKHIVKSHTNDSRPRPEVHASSEEKSVQRTTNDD